MNDGDVVANIVPPCLKFPIGCSSFESLSTLNTFIPSEIGDFVGGACLCLPFVGGTFPPRGNLKAKHVCFSGCALLSVVVVLGGDDTLAVFCQATAEGIALDIV